MIAIFVFAAAIADAGAAAPKSVTGCVEIVPQGSIRPDIVDVFPDRGRSGYASTLVVTVRHGKGESVLPSGLSLQAHNEAVEELKKAGFVFPEQDGSAGARLTTKPDPAHGDRVTTTLELPLLALPEKPGRHVLSLPPLPISIARASGEVATVCTHEHSLTVDDPTAETSDPQPKLNPPPRPQREEWTAMKRAVIYGSIGIAVGAVLAWLVARWLRRPRPVPPPPPPRPPWEVAFEKLDEVRHAGLLSTHRYSEYYDRVGDAVREYFGARYGFDGLECTTDEMLATLRHTALAGVAIEDVAAFLEQCDLVKFARMTPSPDDCTKALADAENIVKKTMVPAQREFPRRQDAPIEPQKRSLAVKRWWVPVMRGISLVFIMWIVVAIFAVVPFWLRATEWPGVKWTSWPWLVVAAVLPPIVVLAMTLGADARVPRLRVPTIAPIALGPRGTRTYFRDLPGILRGAAMIFAFVALARPQNTLRDEQSGERGIDIVIVLDLSGSMRAIMDAPTTPSEAHGKRPTRLDTAKDVILDFIGRRKTDRLGVVVFGRAAYVLAPPTLDYQLLTTLVGKMELDLIDGNGTAIGDAVGVGVARLRRSTAKSKAIVLLTDGDSNAGELSPEYATHLAKTQGVKVYTVQIGNGDDVDVQEGVDLFGQPKYVRRRFPVNPELLKTIANDTGGEAFIATDKKGLESSMHSILDSLEKTKFLAQTASTEDLFPLLLTPAVILLFLEALSRVLVIRRFP